MRSTNEKAVGIVSILAIAALFLAPAAHAHRDHDDDYDSDDGYRRDRGADWAHPGAGSHFNNLYGYGSWHHVAGVGTLWFPYVEAAWRPYYYGHWIHTPLGMTWVSHEPWGEIPHHYGQWVHVDSWGWGWVPGYEYAPAWVTWGVVDGYVGWAPCPPAGYRYSRFHRYRVGLHASRHGFHGSFEYHTSGLDFSWWIFVPDRHFYGGHVYRNALPTRHSLSLFKSKRVLPIGSHLNVQHVRKISKQKVRTYQIDRKKTRVGDRTIDVYEPRGQREKIRSGREIAKRSYTKAPEGKRHFASANRVTTERTGKPKSLSKTERAKKSTSTKSGSRQAGRDAPAKAKSKPKAGAKDGTPHRERVESPSKQHTQKEKEQSAKKSESKKGSERGKKTRER